MMRRAMVLTAAVGAALLLTLTCEAGADQRYVPGELLVQFAPGTRAGDVEAINRELGCEVIVPIEFVDVYRLRIESRLTVEEAVAAYNANPNVEFAEPNYLVGLLDRTPNNAERWPDTNPDDTFDPAEAEFGRQWSLDNWGQTGGKVDADIDAPQMWRMTTDASDVIVAILDTGIDLDHPDLAGNIWVNPDEIPGNGVDDDGNNYVDDVNGYDFVNGDADPDDDYDHGTHVAGIVGAVGNNGEGIAGIAWDVQLMAVKVIEPDILSDHAANVCLGIDYAMHEDADILNMSFRLLEESVAVRLAIERANDAGILVCAAAGNFASDNDTDPLYPASYATANIISVAASNQREDLWFSGPGNGSNWGATTVDLAAPGEDIYSTVRDGYNTFTGTSMAAPHVSGVAALCWSLEPWLTHLELKAHILSVAGSFNAADKEKKPAVRQGGPKPVMTEGRLRAAQNADFGDAPDLPYPTHWPPEAWGAIHLDCGLEWLGYDVSVERSANDADGTDTDGMPNLIDNDGFDDGVSFHQPYFCKGVLPMDRVDVTVTVSDPHSGRYGAGKFLYLTSFFDFNDDGDWQDVFACVLPNDAAEHLLIQAVGGPGAASVVNALPDDVVVIDPALWPAGDPQSMLFELYFYSPPEDTMGDYHWTRFRLEYDDAVWPSPDNKFLGTEFEHSLFGEVEDYFLDPESAVEQPDEETAAPRDFRLGQNTPNPFNPFTRIAYDLPIDSHVTLEIFNAQGRRVATLVDEVQTAGRKSVLWNSTDGAGYGVPSGTYFYKIKAGGYTRTRKMVLLK